MSEQKQTTKRVFLTTPAGFFELCNVSIDMHAGEFLDTTPTGDVIHGLASVSLVGERIHNPLSDAERLAIAVLQGDLEAAFSLADEVQMSLKHPEGFRPRQELEERLKKSETLLEDLRIQFQELEMYSQFPVK